MLVAAAALSLASCSGTGSTSGGLATDEGIAAISFPKEQFRALLVRTVFSTQSAGMHLYALGLDEGCKVFNQAAEAAVGRNLPAWRSNLIDAYRKNVPADLLAEATASSPSAARDMLKGHLPAIASAMQASSEPLLQTASVEVIEATGAAAGKVDQAKVDGAARRKELQAITANGQICGVAAPRQG
jgi:hypothetical protein